MADAWESLPDVKQDDWEKLPDVGKPPSGKVPSGTGWRDADKPEKYYSPYRMASDAEKQETAMWGALASGAHGAAAAMEGPVNGAIAALKKSIPNPFADKPPSWDDVTKAYYDEKNRIEGAQKQNLKDFPHAPIVGALMAGGVGSAPTAAGRIALSAGQGAMYGFGSSKHDLGGENADPAAALSDAKTGGLIGAGAGVLGEAAQLPGRWLAGKAQSLSNATHAASEEAEAAARDGAMRSAIGAHGGDVSAGSNQLKMLRDALTNPDADPALAARAREFLSSPEGKALLNRVLSSNIGRAEGQVGRIQSSQAAMQEAIAANNPEAIKRAASAAAEAKLLDPSGVTKRLAELARRNVPPAVGGMVGGAPGAAAGALVAGAMGKPGTIISNALKSPSMFLPLTKGAAVGIGSGNAMSHSAPPLAEWTRFLKPKDEDKGDE